MEEPWRATVRADALAPGRPLLVDVEGEAVLLVRDGDAVRATSAICPHKFTLLTEGVVEGGHVTCPLHAARFSLLTGEPMPDQHWAGWLQTYPVRVVEGVVQVMLRPRN